MNAPTALGEQEGMSLADFLATDEKIEIINGRVKRTKDGLKPKPHLHSLSIRMLFKLLDGFLSTAPSHEVFAETIFIPPSTTEDNWVKGARIPDVMLVDSASYRAWLATGQAAMMPLAVIPDLVIEVISENDRYHDVIEKVDSYLRDGVKLIWLVDPKLKLITVYRPDGDSLVLLKGDMTLTGGDVLAGFSITLNALFA